MHSKGKNTFAYLHQSPTIPLNYTSWIFPIRIFHQNIMSSSLAHLSSSHWDSPKSSKRLITNKQTHDQKCNLLGNMLLQILKATINPHLVDFNRLLRVWAFLWNTFKRKVLDQQDTLKTFITQLSVTFSRMLKWGSCCCQVWGNINLLVSWVMQWEPRPTEIDSTDVSLLCHLACRLWSDREGVLLCHSFRKILHQVCQEDVCLANLSLTRTGTEIIYSRPDWRSHRM